MSHEERDVRPAEGKPDLSPAWPTDPRLSQAPTPSAFTRGRGQSLTPRLRRSLSQRERQQPSQTNQALPPRKATTVGVCRHLGYCSPALGSTAEMATGRDNRAIRVRPERASEALAAISRSPGQTSPCLRGIPVPELLLTLPSQIPDQPVRVEGVLGRHAPAHDGVQESLALAGVEAENLQAAEVLPGSQRGLGSARLLGASRLLQACWTRTDALATRHGAVRPTSPGQPWHNRIGRALAEADTHLDIPPNSCQQRRERLVPVTLQLSPGLSSAT